MRWCDYSLYSRLNPGDRQPIISRKMPGTNAMEDRKGSLLVVGAESFTAEYIVAALRAEGYDVLTASTAEEGWGLFLREGPRVRAVITEGVMPGGWDGLELARRVRVTAPETPVLLVTAHRPPSPLGPRCAMLPKPFTVEALRFAVRRLVEPCPGVVTYKCHEPGSGWPAQSGSPR
ncbi:MAG: response regulator [Verrucomicrobia bacterium]|nr:response regulator [Verrucomicrobiota bacterium]